MLCAHAKKHRGTMLRALRRSGISPEPIPGLRGHRIPQAVVDDFLQQRWPELPPFSLTRGISLATPVSFASENELSS